MPNEQLDLFDRNHTSTPLDAAAKRSAQIIVAEAQNFVREFVHDPDRRRYNRERWEDPFEMLCLAIFNEDLGKTFKRFADVMRRP
jgi:hypothetical protein